MKDTLLGTDDLVIPTATSVSTSARKTPHDDRAEPEPEPEPAPQPRLSAEEFQAKEKSLRKTAQRGVVQLFNAVRAAQKRGEEAEREVREKGLVGRGRREEKVGDMSREGFLSFVARGGRKGMEGKGKEKGEGEGDREGIVS